MTRPTDPENVNDGGLWQAICGGRYGVVPAHVLINVELSRGARLLFAILCTHADATHCLRRSLNRLAKQLEVSKRTIQKWMRELERHRLVTKLNEPGRMGIYRINRNRDETVVKPDQMVEAAARTARFAEYGKRGANAKAEKKRRSQNEPATDSSPVFDGPANEISPTREQGFAPTEANEISPEHDSLLNKKRGTREDATVNRDGSLATPPEGGSLASAHMQNELTPEPSTNAGVVAQQADGIRPHGLSATSTIASKTKAEREAYKQLSEEYAWADLVNMDQAKLDRLVDERMRGSET